MKEKITELMDRFDEYIFENFKAVLPQADVIKSVCSIGRINTIKAYLI